MWQWQNYVFGIWHGSPVFMHAGGGENPVGFTRHGIVPANLWFALFHDPVI